MGALLDLCHQLGGIVRAKVDRAFTDWMFAVSNTLDANGASLTAFNTIATGAAGSGRLIDLTASQIAGFQTGAEIWVSEPRHGFGGDARRLLRSGRWEHQQR